MAVFLQSLLFLFMVLLSLFLILIILLQRGKGGGLVGAFGGMGGSSAFGAKTGDVFMRITVVAAIIWFLTCIGGRYILDMKSATLLDEVAGAAVPAVPAATDAAAPAETTTPATDAVPAEVPAATDAAAPAPVETPAPAAETPAAPAE